ncbi:hypothetical protein JRO89_XS10G0082900 [Xanthoceras sorbifolium]|uniref:Glycosyl hydrolase family 32 N-terminal domain-containing protein n=1 Tax=Xanthoceras sorbifolium TaxID=99658 RepID=A0ABQ8HI22_9ROSI|nr:hypothetical protein JRO89_XS10G0082900 [Xanthoceras sorbifolium]
MPKNLSDPYLTEWIKYCKNPVMAPTQKDKINASSFRDPTTAWLGPNKVWRVLIGSRVNKLGLAILYKSKDFEHWTLTEKPLHSATGTRMWECPDFFPVKTDGNKGLDMSARGKKVKYVLKNSLDETKHDYYTIGTYDATFFDSEKQRRILWGWANESSSVKDDVQKGWAEVQEIENLRRNQVKWPSKILEGGSKLEVTGVTARQLIKVVITSRVYPTQATDNQIKLFVFNNGTSSIKITYLNAWRLKKAQIS